ncbi:MAG: zinc ribbon domain-containing protein [Coriobacteriales bacterium]|nr:zinc ribbon domain-containing protein [Coriobacteriales bacterium]
MKCPVCETEVLDGIQYCPVCGSDIAMALERTQAMPRTQVSYANNNVAQERYNEPISQVNVRTQPAQVYEEEQYAQPQQRTQRYEQEQNTGSQQRVAQQQQRQNKAVPMNGTPSVSYATVKTIDTSQINPTPKWPIVLIILLVLLIIALVLLIFHPWNPTGPAFTFPGQQTTQSQQNQTDNEGQQTTPAGDQTDTQIQDPTANSGLVEQTPVDTQPVEQQNTTPVETQTQPTGAEKTAAAVATITEVYNSLDFYDSQISNVIVPNFNSYYTSSNQALRQQYAHDTEQTLIELKNLLAQVQGADTSAAPGLESPKQTVASMVDCLIKRTELLSEAWNLLAAASDPYSVASQAESIVGRDNVNGVNQYKTQYMNTYDSFDLNSALAQAGV